MFNLKDFGKNFCSMIKHHFISKQDEMVLIDFFAEQHYDRFTDTFQWYANLAHQDKDSIKIIAKFCIKRKGMMQITNFDWDELFDSVSTDGPEIRYDFSYKDIGNAVLQSV